MRRRHKDEDGSPLCKQRPLKSGLHLEADWHAVDCEACHVVRFLHSRRETEKRKAREAARAATPLLEETRMPDPNDPAFLHEALAARKDPHVELLQQRVEEMQRQHGEEVSGLGGTDCADCPPTVAPDNYLPTGDAGPGEIRFEPTPCNYERLMHRMEGLEALLVSVSQRLDKLATESQARDGVVQRELFETSRQVASLTLAINAPLVVDITKSWGHTHRVSVERVP